MHTISNKFLNKMAKEDVERLSKEMIKRQKPFKNVKHIYKYLTSKEYRTWVDFCTMKKHIDMSMNMILDNLEKTSHPPIIYDRKHNKTILYEKEIS